MSNFETNSKEYLNELYSSDWKSGYGDAYKRLDKEIESLSYYKKHLDVGCADGYFTKKYVEKYPSSIGFGVDISNVVIDEIHHANFLTADVYALPFDDASFDLVHAAELIEHLKEPGKALAEMVRVLEPGGRLVITTPYKEDPLYEEHLWSFDVDMVKELVGIEMVSFDTEFFGNIMRIIFKK